MVDDGPPAPPGRAVAQRRQVVDDLAGARRAAGLSQTEVAARMGTSQSVVARLESGQIDARLSTLQRYAAAVGHDLDLGVRPPERTPMTAGSPANLLPGHPDHPGRWAQPGPSGHPGPPGPSGRAGHPDHPGPPGPSDRAGHPGQAGHPTRSGQPGPSARASHPGQPGYPSRPGEPGQPGRRPGWLPGDPAPTGPRPQGEPHRAEPLAVRLDPLRADLDEQLLRRRIVRVSGRLDVPAAEAALARVLLADADGPDPIQLHLHCPDGDLAAAVVLAETLQLVRARVVAVATGTVGGPVVGAYAAARHRRAHPHARFVLSEPRAQFGGRATQLAADLELQSGQLRFLQETIAAATGHSPDDVAADMQLHRVLAADEAAAYGLVHDVLRGPDAA